MAVLITTDSATDLSTALRQEFSIEMVPLHVTFGGRTGEDSVNVSPVDMFEAARQGEYPKTSAVSVGEYAAFFTPMLAHGDEIVHISLSGTLSSSHANARIFAQDEPRVHVVDSRMGSMGTAMLCILAAKQRDAGDSWEKIVKKTQQLCSKVKAYFFLDKFTFAVKGGRAPYLAAFGANLLGIHVSMHVDGKEAVLAQGKKYRGKQQASQQKWMVEHLEALRGKIETKFGLLAFSPDLPLDQCAFLERLARETLPEVARWMVCQVGCVISAHAGPGGAMFALLER